MYSSPHFYSINGVRFMPIASYIIHAEPGTAAQLKVDIEKYPVAEVPKTIGDTLIVVTETPSPDDDNTFAEELGRLENVRSCSLVFANFEDLGEE